ncbi:MAG: RluA family pseudouridine synthase [Pseudomonadales bacterium]
MQSLPEQELDERWLLEVHPELLVINKPAGLSVLRDRSGQVDLWQRLSARFGKLYQVHRIDKATSGLLLVARSQSLQSSLTRHFNDRTARKTYLAEVHGELQMLGTGCIDLPLRKGRKSRYRVAAQRDSITRSGDCWQVEATDSGVAASTRLRILQTLPARTRLLLQPRTGRTHQLRVHLAWIGHAIVGDPLYGKGQDTAPEPRMLLHAARLVIPGHGRWQAQLDES